MNDTGPAKSIDIARKPHIWLSRIQFNDNSVVDLGANDTVLIVGPNNSGKSATLRELCNKFQNRNIKGPIVTIETVGQDGTKEELLEWMKLRFENPRTQEENIAFRGYVGAVSLDDARNRWVTPTEGLHNLANFFQRHLTTEARLTSANSQGAQDFVNSPPNCPLHSVYLREDLESQLTEHFRQAFGFDLIVNRMAGSQIHLHVGTRPVPMPGEDRLSLEYLRKIYLLPLVSAQGDGIRCYAGVLLEVLCSQFSILYIDEPEAFLHPPQARLLARSLISFKKEQQQLFIATHSADIIHGLLDSGAANVRVLRITRNNDINNVRELKPSDISGLWSDPLLRHSKILEGLFHEHVVVCESDSDCQFYSALLLELSPSTEQSPDVLFTHCGGKDRINKAVIALRAIGVRTSAIVDFDVLNSEEVLKSLVLSFGANWSDLEGDWRAVKKAVDEKKPELSTDEVKSEINKILSSISEQFFPREARKGINAVLRRSSPWAQAKTSGKTVVPSGQPYNHYERLISELRKIGIHVVEVGELEGFDRSVGGHGPSWVAGVFRTGKLKDMDQLKEAREFILSVIKQKQI